MRDGAPGGGGVDDGIPEAHQGKDKTGGVGQGPGGGSRMDKGVDAEDGGGDLWVGKGG